MLVFLCMLFHLCMSGLLLFMLVLLCHSTERRGAVGIMLWHNGYVTK